MKQEWLCFAALATLLEVGCDVRVAPEESLVFHYAEGIQSQHQPTYEDYYLSCHPDQAEKDLSARLAAYESIRRKGFVTFSPDGIEIIKLGALGRGAYFRVREVDHSGDTLQFKTVLKPDYLSINYTEFPPGAVLYLLGEPLGSVQVLKPGKIGGPQRHVLQSVDLQWAWRKRAVSSTTPWCLQSVLPMTESALFRALQFQEAEAAPDEQSSPSR